MPSAFTRLLEARTRSRAVHCGIAACAVSLALGLTVLLRAWTPHAAFMLFVPAVMISAWYGRLLAGTFATLLSVLFVGRFVLESSLLDEIGFIAVATLVAMITSALASGQRRVDDLKRMEVDSERALRTDAELSSQTKNDLLVQVGHELRQPLGVILTAAELLEKAPDTSARERAKVMIERQARHMTRLVEDLLDLSRIERGIFELRTETVDGVQLFDEIARAVRPMMTQNDHQFSVFLPPSPLLVRADSSRLRQIVSNLLTNSAKYTSAGGHIALAVATHGDTLRLSVADTGRGIPSDLLPAVFDLYRKSDPEGGGLGVGLAVVRALTEAHGGSVEARSQGSGRGAEFIVTLPGAVEAQVRCLPA
jgi:signal transduction histidine kinase